MTTEEGNKLIAEFMGATFIGPIGHAKRYIKFPVETGGLYVHNDEGLKYHSSWDWLMPVVEKIETNYQVQVHIQNDACWIKKSFKPYFDFSTISDNSKIEAVWLAVIEFAKFHNRQNSQLAENQAITQP